MKKKDVIEFFEILKKERPEPKTELVYGSNFQLLIAVLLSAQATDVSVNKATKSLFEIAPTPQAMLDLGIDELEQYIKTIGLYHVKARNVLKTSQMLIDEFNGEVPDNFNDLIKLAGVGRKTANVVLNTAFGLEVMAVDTHIFRVSNRTGLAHASTVEGVEDKLMKVIPKQYLLDAHHWLILLGRYTCKARKPECGRCLVSKQCGFADKDEIIQIQNGLK